MLIDFGLAKMAGGVGSGTYAGPTHTGDCGTAGFMAPEVYAKVRACHSGGSGGRV